MGVEKLENSGSRLGDLNPDWPEDGDRIYTVAAHLRGIKQVLANVFPNVVGVVTASADQLNDPVVPAGSKMVFYQPTAPVGWTQFSLGGDYMVVARDGKGGSGGGYHSPTVWEFQSYQPGYLPGQSAVLPGQVGQLSGQVATWRPRAINVILCTKK